MNALLTSCVNYQDWQVQEARIQTKKMLFACFSATVSGKCNEMTLAQWSDLYKSVTIPHTGLDCEVLFQMLDEDQSGRLSLREFFELTSLLHVNVSRRPTANDKAEERHKQAQLNLQQVTHGIAGPNAEHRRRRSISGIGSSRTKPLKVVIPYTDADKPQSAIGKSVGHLLGKISQTLRTIILKRQREIDGVVLWAIVLNLIVYATLSERTDTLSVSARYGVLVRIQEVVLCIMIAELTIRLIAFGPFTVAKSLWGSYDILNVLLAAPQLLLWTKMVPWWDTLTAISCILFLTRLFKLVGAFRDLLHSFLRIMPMILPIAGILVLSAYGFMCIGSMFLSNYQPDDAQDPDFQTFARAALLIFQLVHSSKLHALCLRPCLYLLLQQCLYYVLK